MKKNEEIIQDLLKKLEHISYIRPDSIPNIELYMDQVTTFMDAHLYSAKRHPQDKALTKTMINNYTKNHLLPPPVKKKYSKEHILLLIFIYYFKNLVSLSDIEALFAPLTNGHFGCDKNIDIRLEDIYEDVFALARENFPEIREDLMNKYNKAQKSFKAQCDDREYLILFSLICELAFDVFIKKQMIEQIADTLSRHDSGKKDDKTL